MSNCDTIKKEYGVSVAAATFAFNYENYKVYSIDTLIQYIEETSLPELSGVTYYGEPIAFPYEIQQYPSEDLDQAQSYRELLAGMFQVSPDLFGLVNRVDMNGYTFVLVFDNKIDEYFISDTAIGETVGLYCILGLFNDFGKEIVCLVSTFNTTEDYSSRGTLPIW